LRRKLLLQAEAVIEIFYRQAAQMRFSDLQIADGARISDATGA
jgi:hypothetical protein